jgi:cytoskeletal protein CcmA (bactofilin family)
VRDSLRARRWSAAGAVKVLGNVEVESATVSGSVAVGGTLDAGELASSGALDVYGAVKVRTRLRVRGATHLRGPVDVGELEGSGEVNVVGPLRATGLVHISGALELASSLHADRLVGNGTVHILGDAEATQVELRLHRASRIGSLKAEGVVVRRRPGLPIPGLTKPTLAVARIDAKTVELEGVDCGYLRADRITLGPDCHIARLEGKVVARHPSARVGPESRTPPPYGLTR